MNHRNTAALAAIMSLTISLFGSATLPASADQDNHGRGHQQQYQQQNGRWVNGSNQNGNHYGNGANRYYGSGNPNAGTYPWRNDPNPQRGRNWRPDRVQDRDNRDRDDRNQGSSYNPAPYNGPYYGGNPYDNGNPYYNSNPYNNGNPYNGNPNGPYQGNARLQGVITAVNGDQLTVRQDNGRPIQVDDQPALDNQASGRVYVGRSIHAIGYYQNGVFYATQMN